LAVIEASHILVAGQSGPFVFVHMIPDGARNAAHC
jgi:hypothetical protein